jgi:hypothetical protein
MPQLVIITGPIAADRGRVLRRLICDRRSPTDPRRPAVEHDLVVARWVWGHSWC